MNSIAKQLSAVACAYFALGCGGASNDHARSESVPAQTVATLDDDTPPEQHADGPLPVEGTEADPATDTAATETEAETETAPPIIEEAAPKLAAATLQSVGGDDVIGHVIFAQTGDVVHMSGAFKGLPPGERGIQIRTNGNCSGKGARASGKHFNPTKTKHGPPESAERHVGDFGNLQVDAEGNALFDMKTDSLTVEEEAPVSIVGRSIVITKRKDNGKSQPDGKTGPAIACGVIQLDDGEAANTVSAK